MFLKIIVIACLSYFLLQAQSVDSTVQQQSVDSTVQQQSVEQLKQLLSTVQSVEQLKQLLNTVQQSTVQQSVNSTVQQSTVQQSTVQQSVDGTVQQSVNSTVQQSTVQQSTVQQSVDGTVQQSVDSTVRQSVDSYLGRGKLRTKPTNVVVKTELPQTQLGKDESKKAGRTVAKINKSGDWSMPGCCSGLLFGVAGIGLIGVSAEVLPIATPSVPLNVDADAWSKGYRSKVKSRRLTSGIIGSVIGSIIVIVIFSCVSIN